MEQNQIKDSARHSIWSRIRSLRVVGFVKQVVATVVSTKGNIMNVSGDVLGKALPGPLGQLANIAGKAWGAIGNIANNVAKS
mgnify:CR=1 FL=1